jgi:hypothetical protein
MWSCRVDTMLMIIIATDSWTWNDRHCKRKYFNRNDLFMVHLCNMNKHGSLSLSLSLNSIATKNFDHHSHSSDKTTNNTWITLLVRIRDISLNDRFSSIVLTIQVKISQTWSYRQRTRLFRMYSTFLCSWNTLND